MYSWVNNQSFLIIFSYICGIFVVYLWYICGTFVVHCVTHEVDSVYILTFSIIQRFWGFWTVFKRHKSKILKKVTNIVIKIIEVKHRLEILKFVCLFRQNLFYMMRREESTYQPRFGGYQFNSAHAKVNPHHVMEPIL